ncbi:MAG TPA: HlyD family secretion protein [Thermodesulfobacteriota bacterium]
MTDESAPSHPRTPPVRRRTPRRPSLRAVLLTLGPLALAVAAAVVYLTSGRYVSTDNAYVKAPSVVVSAEVSGRVVEVAVAENQPVTAGTLLVRIDPEPFRIALAQAEAHLAGVRNEIAALRASARQKRHELELAEANLAYSEQQLLRQERLVAERIAARDRLDEARRNADVARRQVEALREELEGILATLGGNPDIAAEAHPRYLEARGARDQAALALRRTTITAPGSGVASQVARLRPGDYVEAGDPLLTLVDIDHVWVEANFKETDLARIRPGAPATVEVDTYPDRTFDAEVESVSPATGAEFSVLPPQNATGNWVKVVQRIPVRLAIHPHGGEPPLRAGMSATVTVDTGRHTPIDRFVAALPWVGAPR